MAAIFYKELWFGDERGYNATGDGYRAPAFCCGLVMKEDITQPFELTTRLEDGCGLVMKEDITQQRCTVASTLESCGLVMKEDITQRNPWLVASPLVVVW